MSSRLSRMGRVFSVVLGVITLADVLVLLAWDVFPRQFPQRSHDFLAAFSLVSIALAYLTYQIVRRPSWREMGKAVMLVAAFLFWAANQLWPALPQAILFNDIAIALFVLDVFWVIVGRSPESFE